MKITWLSQPNETSNENLQSLLQLEYQFRSKTIQKVLKRKEGIYIELEDLHFNFCPKSKSFSVSSATPEPSYTQIKKLI